MQVLLTQAGTPDIARGRTTERVPLDEHLRCRDNAIDFLHDQQTKCIAMGDRQCEIQVAER